MFLTLSIYLSLYIYIYIYIHMHTCVCLCIYIYMYIYMCIYLSIYLSLSLYIYIYTFVPSAGLPAGSQGSPPGRRPSSTAGRRTRLCTNVSWLISTSDFGSDRSLFRRRLNLIESGTRIVSAESSLCAAMHSPACVAPGLRTGRPLSLSFSLSLSLSPSPARSPSPSPSLLATKLPCSGPSPRRAPPPPRFALHRNSGAPAVFTGASGGSPEQVLKGAAAMSARRRSN